MASVRTNNQNNVEAYSEDDYTFPVITPSYIDQDNYTFYDYINGEFVQVYFPPLPDEEIEI